MTRSDRGSDEGSGSVDTGAGADRGAWPAPDLGVVLSRYAPFDSLPEQVRRELVQAARVEHYAPGAVILDAFTDPSPAVYVVVEGRVGLWHEADRLDGPADEAIGVGAVFGFTAMLSERSVGPRAVALTPATVARLPQREASAAFATRRGAAFLVRTFLTTPGPTPPITFRRVEALLHPALELAPTHTLAQAAERMTREHRSAAAVDLGHGDWGPLTDAVLRRHGFAAGLSGDAPVSAVALVPGPRAILGDSAAEVLIRMLESELDALLVTDRAGILRGVVTLRDYALSPAVVDVSIHDRLRRSATTAALTERARQVPDLLTELLGAGLSSASVIAVYSGIVDTTVRRAIELTIEPEEGLLTDDFTWMALGSNGRREAVPSSDVDSAVAFADHVDAARQIAYRAAFGRVTAVLAEAGLTGDSHGATAHRPAFSRTHAQWRASAQAWVADPVQQQGAMMTSLLVDSRPIYGDLGLPAAVVVLRGLREHPGTLRLLLDDSLSVRPRAPSREGLLRRRGDFDIKHQALLPLVNLARWSALSARSPALSTVARLRAAAGSPMLPQEQAQILIEVFGVLQRLRLRYQLMQISAGLRPTDHLSYERLSPIDRSVVAQAVREISQVQHRMSNVALYVDAREWTRPESS